MGAGIAGLACASALLDAGQRVTVFDKGRRPGGRIATRRLDGSSFNHGAQYATAKGPGFQALLAQLQQAGSVAPWPEASRGAVAWVGVPGMSAVTGAMAERITGAGGEILTERHVSWLHREGRLRHVPAAEARPGSTIDAGGDLSEPFDAVLLAVPAPQAMVLLETISHAFSSRLDAVRMAPCWAVMATFADPVLAADTLRPADHKLSWIARENSRPSRATLPDAWTLHASAAWSRAHLEDSPSDVAQALLGDFQALTGSSEPPLSIAAHRWRYAQVETPLGEPCLWDASTRIGLCGDWCDGPRIEAAYDSGVALARAVLL